MPGDDLRTPVLQRLREATRDQHSRLERRLALDEPDYTLDSYRKLLVAFCGFYRPLERQLSAGVRGVANLEWERRIKLARLVNDLRVLGMRPQQIEQVADCPVLPGVSTMPSVLGCLYVLEGSTLGGQVIKRQLEERFGWAVRDALSFFTSYGPDVGLLWRRFLQCLAEVSELHAINAAASSASETFCALESWLDQSGILQ